MSVFNHRKTEDDTFYVPKLVHQIDGMFHDGIYERLPKSLVDIVDIGNNRQERDVLLIGALTILSGCMPNVFGIYDNRKVYPNLFAFIDAPAGAGKGVLNHLRLIGKEIHKQRIETTRLAIQVYEERKAEMKSKNEDTSSLPLPKQKLLFIPANSSASSFIHTLTENDEMGILFSTEADTLANSLTQDWGNFSDVLRCAFHHESVEMQRRSNREYLVIEEPRLSVLLTGTNGQFRRLIPNTENGLFSRFMYYTMRSVPKFRNVFDQRDTVPGQVCEDLGHKMIEIYNHLVSNENGIVWKINPEQQAHFIDFFSHFTKHYYEESGERVLATIHRSGLIAFRISMILSTLRWYLDLEKREIPDGLVHKKDLQAAMQITLHTIQHSLIHMADMPKNRELSTKHKRLNTFIDKLPDTFLRVDASKVGKTMNLSEATISRYLVQGPFERLGQGSYKKIKDYQNANLSK